MTCKKDRYDTMNPLCSNKPQDLHDNAIILDAYVNSGSFYVSDRFGIERLTLTGLQNKVDVKLETLSDDMTAQIDEKIIAQGGVEIAQEWGDSDSKALSQGFIQGNLGYVTPQMFGAVGDGVSDDTDSFKALIAHKNIFIPAGTYVVSDSIKFSGGVNIVGAGKNFSIIKSVDKSTPYSSNFVIGIVGEEPSFIGFLSNTLVKGESKIPVNDLGDECISGDVYMILNDADFSFQHDRPYYKDGEYVEVSFVKDGYAYLLNPLYSKYDAGDVKIYKCNSYSTANMRNISVTAPGVDSVNGNVSAISARFTNGLVINDVFAQGAGDATVSITCSLNIDIKSCTFVQNEDFTTETMYGLVFGNVQNTDVSGSFTGFRHGIAHGGGSEFNITNRNCNVHSFTAQSLNSGTASVDFHGNSEFYRVSNGILLGGGAAIGGDNSKWSDLQIITPIAAIKLTEVNGINHSFNNISISVPNDFNGHAVIDVGENSNTLSENVTRGGSLVFRDVDATINNSTVIPCLIGIHARGSLSTNNGQSLFLSNISSNLSSNLLKTIPKVKINVSNGSLFNELIIDGGTYDESQIQEIIIQSGSYERISIPPYTIYFSGTFSNSVVTNVSITTDSKYPLNSLDFKNCIVNITNPRSYGYTARNFEILNNGREIAFQIDHISSFSGDFFEGYISFIND